MAETEEIKQLIKKAELDRVLIENEKEKLAIKKLEKELSKKWYQSDFWVKASAAIGIALPLIVLLVYKIIIPTSEARNLESKLDYKTAELRLLEKQISLNKILEEREKEIRNLNKDYRDMVLTSEAKIIQLSNELKESKDKYHGVSEGITKSILEYESELQRKKTEIENEVARLFVTIDISEITEAIPTIKVPASNFENFQDFLNFLYLDYLKFYFSAYSYGENWILLTKEGTEIQKESELDVREMSAVGITNGVRLKVVELPDKFN